jgi:peptide chain release factor 2
MAELSELNTQSHAILDEATELYSSLNIAAREDKLGEVERQTEDPSLWGDPDSAQQVMAELARRRNELTPWRRLMSLAEDTALLAELAVEANDIASIEEIEHNLTDLRGLLSRLHAEALFADVHDASNAIVEINAGAGGTEACDWAAMLGRMYLRWCERHGFQAEVIDSQPGEEVGVKSMIIDVQGSNAYGMLKSERGAHRLIRFSPFNAQNLRQTSFASVGVIPDVGDDVDIEVRDEDIKVDTYRSSGAGGQHVNKTESAIRITHLASGIVVTCQNERSQIKNRASAMHVLKARLLDRQRVQQEEAMAQIRGVKTDIAFGNQIRTYWLQPYTLVKDHRTEYETGNANAVLEGDLDDFMYAYLEMISRQRVGELE